MSNEKQIEEMAKAVKEQIHENCSMAKVYEALYNAGYRKQSEGGWKVTRTEIAWNCAEYPTEYTCSLCGRIQPFAERYCPDGGSKMKGA